MLRFKGSRNPYSLILLLSSLENYNEEVTGDERATRKEHLLEVAQRVQSEYSFRYVASEDDSAEDLTGLSSTNE